MGAPAPASPHSGVQSLRLAQPGQVARSAEGAGVAGRGRVGDRPTKGGQVGVDLLEGLVVRVPGTTAVPAGRAV